MDLLKAPGFFSTCQKAAARAAPLTEAGARAALASLRVLRLAAAAGLFLPLLLLGLLLSLGAMACLEVSNFLAERLSQNTTTSANTPAKRA